MRTTGGFKSSVWWPRCRPLAAYAYRHHRGLPAVYPGNELSYTANFLNMLFRIGGREYTPNPVLERALDVLFILHADHEQNCSATTMRVIGSAESRPILLPGRCAMGALFGPLHGGANEAVLRMLKRIGSMDNIPAFMEGVKNRKERLMGFGHRVYKAYDPRASIIKRTADEVFEVTGRNPLLDIALELEKIALEDDFFVSRNLYPNVDFYSGLIYQVSGIPRGDVPRPLRHTAHGGMARAVGGDARGQGAAYRPSQADLHRERQEGFRGDRGSVVRTVDLQGPPWRSNDVSVLPIDVSAPRSTRAGSRRTGSTGSSRPLVDPGPRHFSGRDSKPEWSSPGPRVLTDLRHLLLTHVHLDHAGGTGHLVERFPQRPGTRARGRVRPTWRTPRGSCRARGGPSEIGTTGSGGTCCPFQRTVSEPGGPIHAPVRFRAFECFRHPGHIGHHVSYLAENDGILLAGDAMGVILAPGAPTHPAGRHPR